jgi:hypothetical protein
MNQSMQSVQQSAEKTEGFLSRLGKLVGLGALTKQVGGVALEMGGFNTKVGEVTDEMIAFHGATEDGKSSLNRYEKTMAAFVKTASLGITPAQKEIADQLAITKAIETRAESTEELTSKIQHLKKAQYTESTKAINFDPGTWKIFGGEGGKKAREDVQSRLQIAIRNAEEQLEKKRGAQLGAQVDTSAGSNQRLALLKLEQDTAQKKAEAEQKLKDASGNLSADNQKLLIQEKALIDAEFNRAKKALEIGEIQEKNAANLNEIAEQTSIEYADQLNLQREKIAANEVEVEKANKLFGVHSLIASQLRAQGHELTLHAQEMEYMHAAAIEQAKDATSLMELQLAGNKTLAELEQHRVANAQKIRDAIRSGNIELAQQFAKQQTLSDLESRAKQFQQTPQQRQRERIQQQKDDAAQKAIAARDKDVHSRAEALRKGNPAKYAGKTDDEILGRTTNYNHRSKSAEQARKEYAERHAEPIVAGAKNKLQEMQVGTIIVTQIQPP